MSVVGFKTVNQHAVLYFKQAHLVDPVLLREAEKQIFDHLERLPMGLDVVVNFDDVTAASSQMIGLLLGVKQLVSDRFGTLTLCRVGPQIMEILQLTRLDRQFVIVPRMRDVVGRVPVASSDRRRGYTGDTAWIN
jgi:anti-anti-sigma factor